MTLTHVAEILELFPEMGWGLPTSPGHYLDLVSAILGCALLPLGFLGNAIVRRKKFKVRLDEGEFTEGQALPYGVVWVLSPGNSLCITIATAAAPGSLSYALF